MYVTKVLLLLAAVAAPLAATAELDSGPPAVCFPLDIGKHQSIPWGNDAFQRAKGYGIERLTGDVVKVLDQSAVAVVHMETLRRAAVCIATKDPAGKASKEQRMDLQRKLTMALQRRALDAFLDQPADGKPKGKKLGLALLDLGYFLGALGQLGSGRDHQGEAELLRATRLMGQDGNVWLAYCLGAFEANNHRFPPHALQKLCQLAASDPLLKTNLVETVGVVSGHNSYDELVAWANQQSAGAK